MEWFKVSTSTVFGVTEDFTDKEYRGFMAILALTSALEREPKLKEMRAFLTKKTLFLIQEKLKKQQKNIEYFQKIILDDISKVNENREYERIKKRNQREAKKSAIQAQENILSIKDVPRDVPKNVPRDVPGGQYQYVPGDVPKNVPPPMKNKNKSNKNIYALNNTYSDINNNNNNKNEKQELGNIELSPEWLSSFLKKLNYQKTRIENGSNIMPKTKLWTNAAELYTARKVRLARGSKKIPDPISYRQSIIRGLSNGQIDPLEIIEHVVSEISYLTIKLESERKTQALQQQSYFDSDERRLNLEISERNKKYAMQVFDGLSEIDRNRLLVETENKIKTELGATSDRFMPKRGTPLFDAELINQLENWGYINRRSLN